MTYEVKRISRAECAPYVLEIHYAKRWPSISYAFGLFFHGDLCGIVSYGRPASRHMQRGACPSDPNSVLELNRLCLKHNRKNEASRLVSSSLAMMPPHIIVSYADTAEGHKGYVYRASNFYYAGWTDMDRKTARLDYINEGKHSRAAFRSGEGALSKTVRRKPKAKYWTVTGDKRQKKRLMAMVNLPMMDWKMLPPPCEHVYCPPHRSNTEATTCPA